MKNNDWLIYDGAFKPAEQPLISVRSRGLMYGDGCFDTFRSYSGRFFALEKHLNRLKEGTEFLGMVFPDVLKQTSFQGLLYSLLKKNKLLDKDAIVRVQVWRAGGRGYQTEPRSSAHFTVTASKYAADEPVVPAALATADIKRIPDQALPSRYKLSNGISYIIAARQAQTKGADDALMLTTDNRVSETTIANVFWVKGKTVYTPSTVCDLLPGITREILIEVLKNSTACKVEEGSFSPDEVLNAEAVWICNSVRELVPVGRIDDQSFPARHPLFEEIKEKFVEYRDQKLVPLT